jgi:hypothetical protein
LSHQLMNVSQAAPNQMATATAPGSG